MDSAPITRSPASRRLKVRKDLNNDFFPTFFSSDLDLQNERMPPRKDASSEVDELSIKSLHVITYSQFPALHCIVTDCKNLMLQASPVDGPAKTNNSHAFSS